MKTTVSVIIPTYNYGRFIRNAIESVLTQTYPPHEILVIDDGSTDDTESIVAVFGDRVRYVKQANAGVCAARNRGAAESSAEYVAFMDADDLWLATKLEKQIAVFAGDSEIKLTHCGMREFDSETGETLRILIDGKAGWVADGLLLWESPVIIGPGGTIVVDRGIFDDIGGFDPELKVGEDWDFCYRIARKYKVGFVAEPLVEYRSHSAAAHRNVANMEKGMRRFYEKAFMTTDLDVLKLKPRAYGNYHRVLSGSYFHVGEYSKFMEHAVKSIWARPSNLAYFLKFPLRRIRSN